jgi:hypothetical protein
MTNLNPEDFRPKVKGESDFFSWQLYRWLKKHKHYTRIYKGTWNSITGHDLSRDVFYIGRKDDKDSSWCHCRELRNLCTYRSGLEMFAYGGCHGVKDWEDVTEWFWDEYRRIGVCAIHGDYAHKWNYLYPTKRKCEYCGKIETSHTKTIKQEVWK